MRPTLCPPLMQEVRDKVIPRLTALYLIKVPLYDHLFFRMGSHGSISLGVWNEHPLYKNTNEDINWKTIMSYEHLWAISETWDAG